LKHRANFTFFLFVYLVFSFPLFLAFILSRRDLRCSISAYVITLFRSFFHSVLAARPYRFVKYLNCFSRLSARLHYNRALKVTSVEVVETCSNVIAAVVSAIIQHYWTMTALLAANVGVIHEMGHGPPRVSETCHLSSTPFASQVLFIFSPSTLLFHIHIRGCIHKFRDWPSGSRAVIAQSV
jgi:hypothetical protein